MSMKWILGGVMLALATTNFGCVSVPNPPTVDHVDMSKYSGRWYEVARIPHLFDYFNVADTGQYFTIYGNSRAMGFFKDPNVFAPFLVPPIV